MPINSVVSPTPQLLHIVSSLYEQNIQENTTFYDIFMKHHTASSLMWGFTGLWWFQSHPSRLHNNEDGFIGNSEHDKKGFKQSDQ